MPNPTISRIQLPGVNGQPGNIYDLKDEKAREDIASIINTVSGTMAWIGITTTALADGDTTNPIVIDGESVTAIQGSVVGYGNLEFVFNGTRWQEFGSTGSLRALAFKNSAEGNFTPAGTISAINFTGTEAQLSGNVNVSGSVSISTGAGDANYTPAGTITTPTISVIPTTDTVASVTSVGTSASCTMPTFSTTVSNELLTFNWTDGAYTAGTLPTTENVTVATGIQSATSSQPTFQGTGVELAGTFRGTEAAVNITYTPQGTINTPTFTGTPDTVTVS